MLALSSFQPICSISYSLASSSLPSLFFSSSLTAVAVSVSRFICQSELYDMSLTLDVNVEIYPLEVSERFKLLLTNNVSQQQGESKQNLWDPKVSYIFISHLVSHKARVLGQQV